MDNLYAYLRCSNCGSVNRLKRENLHSNAQCGSCKTQLSISRDVVAVTDSSFQKEVKNWPGPVLVDFWAQSCGYCVQMMPVVREIASEKAGLLKVVTANTMENQYTASSLGIQGVPSFFLFQNGRLVNSMSGALPKLQFEQWIYQSLGL